MSLHLNDEVGLFSDSVESISIQSIGRAHIRIYLCVDGPITDVQNAYLSNNASKFHIIVRNEKNIGLASSLNRLIDQLGDEEFVFRMDGDDLNHPRRFEVQANFLRRNAKICLVGCQSWEMDEGGKIIQERNYPLEHRSVVRLICRCMPILHPTFCMRRDLLRDSRIRYPDAYLAEDVAFLVRVIECGYSVGNVEERLFYWRMSKEFYGRRGIRRGISEFKQFMKAVYITRGLLTFQYLFPLFRLMFRLLPKNILPIFYRSELRQRILR